MCVIVCQYGTIMNVVHCLEEGTSESGAGEAGKMPKQYLDFEFYQSL